MSKFDDLSPEDREKLKTKMFITPINSVEAYVNWVDLFLGIRLPDTSVNEGAVSPAEALYEIYRMVIDKKAHECPQVVLLSARDCFKTLSATILSFTLFCHAELPLALAGAIKLQAFKASSYLTNYFRKCEPYLKANGWSKASDNKQRLEWITAGNEGIYMSVLSGTKTALNGEHVPVLCVDGKTKILIKSSGETANKRDRVSRTARGIYNRHQKGELIEALSLNHRTGQLQFQPILLSFKNKKDLYKIKFKGNVFTHKNSTMANNTKQKTCIEKELIIGLKHPLFVLGKGYIKYQDIQLGDKVLFLYKSKIQTKLNNCKPDDKPVFSYPKSNKLDQLLLGSLLGDGGCYRRGNNNAYYQELHGIEQKDYLLHKMSILEKNGFYVNFYNIEKNGYSQKPACRISTRNYPELNKWSNVRKNMDLIEQLNPLGLMYWYGDDGNCGNKFGLNTHSFTYGQNVKLSKMLKNNFNIKTKVVKKHKDDKTYYMIEGGVQAKYKMIKLIEHEDIIIPSDIKYKFKLTKTIKQCHACGREFTTKTTDNRSDYCNKVECQLIRQNGFYPLEVVSKEFDRHDTVYDFTIDKNHNFFGNNILNKNSLDEIDLFDPEAYKEAAMIPSMYKGYYPITIYLSTRKYAGGLMQTTLDRVEKIGKVYKWNIIDVTERITHEEARVDEPKIKRYIQIKMPLVNLSPEEYERLNEKEQQKYEMIMAYAGIAEHQLLPAMKNMLVDRSQDDHGNLFKPVMAVLNNFLGLDPDMAEAQLLCNEPSRAGLIYSRFSNTDNVISIEKAYEDLMGVPPREGFGYWDFIDILNKAGVPMIGSVDWGWTDHTSFCVTALMPNQQAVVIYNDSADKMAINEIEIKLKAIMNDFKNIEVIYGDSAYPAYINHFQSVIMPDGSKMPMIGVEKGRDSVLDGITTVQNLIVNASNERRLQILQCEQNEKLIESFGIYKWQQDQAGEPIEGKPSHDGWVGDVQDSLRYGIYMIFKLGKALGIRVASDIDIPNNKAKNMRTESDPNRAIFKNELNKLVDHDLDQQTKHDAKPRKKRGGVKIV